MAIIKCKCCGGDIDLAGDKTFGTCEFCGSTMTLPKVDDDQRAAAFNRGNHFRRQGEFDKAIAVYERIVAEDDTEAEAHWCCALCRFGIEYVEDPATYEWLPTCHRASFDSFLEDVDYLAAVEHSDGITKRQYQKDASKIAEVQRGILATSQNEEPFDVFICYKESEDSGERTRDSLLAQEIYYQLTEQGRRVFFARITLEDKAGTEYEPYIFAALNSARVMVAVGTTPEHFNAVWVKNEWSRFLALMRKDRKKLLLPCYRDMDPYDLPEQLSVLQSYDMAKIGFIQDLTRGISKVLDDEKKPETQTVKETVVVQQTSSGGSNASALLKRGYMALEDGEWDKADEFFEEVLNQDAESAEAYIGKLLAKTKVSNLDGFVQYYSRKTIACGSEKLEACPENHARVAEAEEKYEVEGYLKSSQYTDMYKFDRTYSSQVSARKKQKSDTLAELKSDRLLTRAQSFASDETKQKLENTIAEITTLLDKRISEAQAADKRSIESIKKGYAAHLDESDRKAEKMKGQAETRRDTEYQHACTAMRKAEEPADFDAAQKRFSELGSYKDSKGLAEECARKAEALREAKQQQEAKEKALQEAAAKRRAKNRRIITGIIAAAIVACIAAVVVVTQVIIPNNNYNAAVTLMDSGDYEAAITAFKAMDGYKDSATQIENCQTAIKDNNYNAAVALMDSGDYEAAIAAFEALNGYKDSEDQIEACQTAIEDNNYNAAVALMESGDYEAAITAFEAMDGYKDSADQINECNYLTAIAELEGGQYTEAYNMFITMKGYKDVDTLLATDDNLIAAAAARDAAYQPGKYVTFGSYEQDNNTANGKEDIEWLVLARDGDKALLISKYALDCQQYNTSYTDVTWESCSLRTWLNGTFLNAAFSSDEAAMIATTTVTADKNPEYSTSAGNNTQDQVFLLSITEVEKYFSSDNDRKCVPTAYAIA